MDARLLGEVGSQWLPTKVGCVGVTRIYLEAAWCENPMAKRLGFLEK